jgi:hypothetical protein
MAMLGSPASYNATCGSRKCRGEGPLRRTVVSVLGLAQHNSIYKDTRNGPGWLYFLNDKVSNSLGDFEDGLYALPLSKPGFKGLQPTVLIANTSGCSPYQKSFVALCYSRPIDGAFTRAQDLSLELEALSTPPSNPGDLEGSLLGHNFFDLPPFDELTLFFPEQILFNVQDFSAGDMSVRIGGNPKLQLFADAFVAGCRQHPLKSQSYMEWLGSVNPGPEAWHRGGFPIPWSCPDGVQPPISNCTLSSFFDGASWIAC